MLDLPLLAEYGTYHRDKRNLVCHEIGIPLIVLSIVALMRLAHAGPVDLAMLALVAVSIYYFRLAGFAALGAVALLVVLYFVSLFVSWPVAVGMFVVGWIFQFVGHAYEGKSPAFLTNIQHLLVGPLWIVAVLQARLAPRRARID
jgi:uncharacterized membrane protein YGL010W